MESIQQCLIRIRQSLPSFYNEEERLQLSYLLIEHLTGKNKAQILMDKHSILSDEIYENLQSIIHRLQQNEPVQHIIKQEWFCGMPFRVTPYTLIPRPETAELVDWICQEEHPTRILDIGTGSGCIIISLACHFLQAQCTGIDISSEALAVAEENAQKNNAYVTFKQMDILAEQHSCMDTFDVIVSNPPYICEKEKKDMDPNVVDYEPHTALFVPDNDPLLFYKAIGKFALNNLSKKGVLYFEINQNYGNETCQLLTSLGFKNISMRQDIFGNDRMIRATL